MSDRDIWTTQANINDLTRKTLDDLYKQVRYLTIGVIVTTISLFALLVAMVTP